MSPTPRAVEDQRRASEPNGIDLGVSVGALGGLTSGGDNSAARGLDSTEEAGTLADILRNAVGADDSDVLSSRAEIGREAFTPEQVARTVKELKENPPANFDLSRKARVFSTRFQFVDPAHRGAEWTKRVIKLSSLLLNPDVPEELQELFETRVRPFSSHVNQTVEVPTLVHGQVAYSKDGKPIPSPMTQADMEKAWKQIVDRYLRRLKGFGWLMDKSEKREFEDAISAYETVLKKWVAGFREIVAKDEAALIKRLVDVIKKRAEQASPAAKDKLKDIEGVVQAGIQKLRIIEPTVKLVFKEISWESARDAEFANALREAFPDRDLAKWFEEFDAAPQI